MQNVKKKNNNKKSPKSTTKSNKVQQHVTVVTDVTDNLNYFTQRVNTPEVIMRPCKKMENKISLMAIKQHNKEGWFHSPPPTSSSDCSIITEDDSDGSLRINNDMSISLKSEKNLKKYCNIINMMCINLVRYRLCHYLK